MSKFDVLMIAVAVVVLMIFGWMVAVHDSGMDRACMDESWWIYVD